MLSEFVLAMLHDWEFVQVLYELRQDPNENQLSDEDLDKNWFSMQSAVKI